jgi:hypothetical protein
VKESFEGGISIIKPDNSFILIPLTAETWFAFRFVYSVLLFAARHDLTQEENHDNISNRINNGVKKG